LNLDRLKGTLRVAAVEANGNDHVLTVIDVGGVRAGSLVCWENYMPLARMAMYGARDRRVARTDVVSLRQPVLIDSWWPDRARLRC